jgi:hypothetical protein
LRRNFDAAGVVDPRTRVCSPGRVPYTWMAVIYRCAGRTDDAQKFNRDIIRLFPMTRHALYAMDRMLHPQVEACQAWS